MKELVADVRKIVTEAINDTLELAAKEADQVPDRHPCCDAQFRAGCHASAKAIREAKAK